MLYAHKKHLVSAERLKERTELHTIDSMQIGLPGEYLLTDQKGNKQIASEEHFESMWEPVAKVESDMAEAMKRGYIEMAEINLEEANAAVHTYNDGLFKE